MAKNQTWVSTAKNMRPVLDEAYSTFPDAGNDSQAYTRALFHWYHGRQENSKRGALDRIETQLLELSDRITSLEGLRMDTVGLSIRFGSLEIALKEIRKFIDDTTSRS